MAAQTCFGDAQSVAFRALPWCMCEGPHDGVLCLCRADPIVFGRDRDGSLLGAQGFADRLALCYRDLFRCYKEARVRVLRP